LVYLYSTTMNEIQHDFEHLFVQIPCKLFEVFYPVRSCTSNNSSVFQTNTSNTHQPRYRNGTNAGHGIFLGTLRPL